MNLEECEINLPRSIIRYHSRIFIEASSKFIINSIGIFNLRAENQTLDLIDTKDDLLKRDILCEYKNAISFKH